MAKRTNIVRIITNEIENGNTYITKNGNFVSEEMLDFSIKEDFIRALRSNEIDVTTSFDKYREDALAGYVKTQEVLDGICEDFHLVNVYKSKDIEPTEAKDINSEVNPPAEEAPAEEKKAKRSPKKDVKASE